MNDRVKDILEWVVCIAIALVLALVIKHYLITPTVVKQISMYPTLKNNDRLLLDRWSRTTKKPLKRGEIITFEAPSKREYVSNEVDMQNPKAVYDRNFRSGFQKFLYYVMEISKESYIKRVIALEGEHITISESGDVYINGEKLDEPYLEEGLTTRRTGEFYDLIVPEGYVFAMGDNRNRSMDCREFGCIPLEKVEGKVICRFWPLNQMGKVM